MYIDLFNAFEVLFAVLAIGAILEYVGHAIHHGHRKNRPMR
jgi:hypothetical protein